MRLKAQCCMRNIGKVALLQALYFSIKDEESV